MNIHGPCNMVMILEYAAYYMQVPKLENLSLKTLDLNCNHSGRSPTNIGIQIDQQEPYCDTAQYYCGTQYHYVQMGMDTRLLQRILLDCSTILTLCICTKGVGPNQLRLNFDPLRFISPVDQMLDLRIHHTIVFFFHHVNIFLCSQNS